MGFSFMGLGYIGLQRSNLFREAPPLPFFVRDTPGQYGITTQTFFRDTPGQYGGTTPTFRVEYWVLALWVWIYRVAALQSV